ncbi:MAG: hypothetical protein HKN80_15225 [Acidimicrobiia bacterium]|nr:hypothetical protein [Acidimicrobiia bacterium]
MHPLSDLRRAFWLASLAFLPLFLWWLGWFPAFISSDSLDQLGQVESGDFTNGHPAFHTITMWFITRLWDSAGAITLVQIVVLALLLGLIAKRLRELGVPLWLAVGAAWAVGLSPAVGPTAITIWKDIAFTLAFLWVFSELLLLARVQRAFWLDLWSPVRLGAGLSLLWLFRHNGLLTMLGVLAVLAMMNRRNLGRLVPTVLTAAGIVLLIQGPVFWLFTVDRSIPNATEVMLPVVASSFIHEPDNFSSEELALLASIAPLETWRSRYDCDRFDPLLFDPALSVDVIRQDPGPVLELELRTLWRDLDTSLGFFWCRASFLLVPPQPADSYLQRPPFAIPANDLGLERSPRWSVAADLTGDVFAAAESPSWLWLTWRPALIIWSAIATYVALAWRGPRALALPGALFGLHLLNVAASSLNHEFRLALPLYVMGILSLPLLWFVFSPLADEPPRRAFPNDDVTAVGAGQRQSQGIE